MTASTRYGLSHSAPTGTPSARPRRRTGALTALVLTTLLTAACGALTVHQVVTDPSRYRDRDVKLSGEVVDSYSFLNRGAYRIDDGTGQLWVVSDKGVPRKSARVTVKGKVREGFNLSSLGDRINLPMGIGSGLVLTESSHTSRR